MSMQLKQLELDVQIEIAHLELHGFLEQHALVRAAFDSTSRYFEGEPRIYGIGISDRCPKCEKAYTVTLGSVPPEVAATMVFGWSKLAAPEKSEQGKI